MSIIAQLKQLDVRRWTDDAIAILNKTQLREFSLSNFPAVPLRDLELARMCKENPPTSADKIYARRIVKRSAAQKDAHVLPDEAIISMGGKQHFTDKVATIQLGAETLSRVNSPVPAPFDSKETERPHMQAIVPLCSQLVTMKGGEWIATSLEGWQTVFKTLDVPELLGMSATLILILNQDPSWTVRSLTQRLAVTGVKQLMFVREALQKCEMFVYEYIHSWFVGRVLPVYMRRGKVFYPNIDDDDKPVVSDTVYKQNKRKLTADEIEIIRGKMPMMNWYLGSFNPLLSFPPCKGDLQSAEESLRTMRVITGGDSTAAMMLSQMKGFSGLCSKNGRKIHFILGATLSCWMSGKTVDIRLNTNGDIPILMSSLNAMLRKMPVKDGENWYPRDWYRFISADNKPLTYAEEIRLFFVTTHRAEAVAVWYNDKQLPTAGTKGAVVDYDVLSKELIPEGVTNFFAYSPIYGIEMFGRDKAALEVRKQRSKMVTPRVDVYVYYFTNASQFHGVISSMENATLAGYGARHKYEGKEFNTTTTPVRDLPSLTSVTNYDFSGSEGLVKLPMIRVDVESHWYELVCNDCKNVVRGIFTTYARYSPISNLIYLGKKGLEMQRYLQVENEGQYVPVAIYKSNHTVRKVIEEDWGDEEARPVDEDNFIDEDRDEEEGWQQTNLTASTQKMAELVVHAAKSESSKEKEKEKQAEVLEQEKKPKKRASKQVKKRKKVVAIKNEYSDGSDGEEGSGIEEEPEDVGTQGD